MRLRIRPGLVLAWRGPGRLQIGLHHRYGVVLDGLTAADEQVLDRLLAGTHDLDGLVDAASGLGSAGPLVQRLVGALTDAGVLVDLPTPLRPVHDLGERARSRLAVSARTLSLDEASGGDGWDVLVGRSRASAAVVGLGRTGLSVATALAGAGVGTVVVSDERPVGIDDVHPGGYGWADVGRSREVAAARLVAAHAAGTTAAATDRLQPAVVVLTASDAIDPSRYDGLLREDVSHLPVVLREGDAVVGPLVRPGVTCCLRCLDLYRADRDPEWPRVLAQVAGRPDRGHDPCLSDLAAALAVTQALAEIDGCLRPTSLGCSLEVSLRNPVPVLRTWPAHPRCGCRWPPVDAVAGATRTMGT